ncbi:terminase gpP N-terminus-related DNA-binding protein [Halorientalis marina]|uniref:terminase gpP N-terminus-related DNA-binding protein n=1 Tax=Halorientalis marina TaxID=2931976 RepID=UPI001FF4207B|nr:hypothetical protein [Halorientalis marina]
MSESFSDRVTTLVEETALSDQQARVALYRYQGYSWTEISEEMDIGRDTARNYHDRAKEKYEQASATVERLEEIGFGAE